MIQLNKNQRDVQQARNKVISGLNEIMRIVLSYSEELKISERDKIYDEKGLTSDGLVTELEKVEDAVSEYVKNCTDYLEEVEDIDVNEKKDLTSEFLNKLTEGYSIKEATDWISDAVDDKDKGSLRKGLRLKKDEKVTDVSPKRVITYANKSEDNQKQVILAYNLWQSNKNIKHSGAEKKFWDTVMDAINKD